MLIESPRWEQARRTVPAVVFLDEIDALVSARSETGDSSGGVQQRMLAALLNEMDGIDRVAGVLVVSNWTFVSLTTDGVGALRCLGKRAYGVAGSQLQCGNHSVL